MTVTIHHKDTQKAAVVNAKGVLISGVQSALDFIATLRYEHDCEKAAVYKENLLPAFFDLKTGIAGEILQKFTTYQTQLAIIGDFSEYQSKSLHDFIYECNKGRHICFAPDESFAVDWLFSRQS